MTNLKQKRFVDTDYLKEQLDSTTVEVEGSHIKATETKIGYTTDIEIHGNTVQDASNLADIRSVGEKVEGQELYEIPVLSRGKNLFNGKLEQGTYTYDGSSKMQISGEIRNVNPIYVKGGSTICFTSNTSVGILVWEYNSLGVCELKSPSTVNMNVGFKLRENTKYINFRLGTSDENVVLQIEEGTQATPYEPYQEDKITILSPTPLEKVGDVADRIICKDGVWGIEKNIVKQVLKSSNNWSYRQRNGSFYMYQVALPIKSKRQYDKKLITNKYNNFSLSWNEQYEYCFINEYNGFIVNSLESTLEDFKASFPSNGLEIYHETATSTFIPLPHDQQIKLRTFANKTNISFLTEIEGYIKCKVPKSVGGTLESLVEKAKMTDDRLELLENVSEGNNMKYSTDTGIIHCKDTKKGRVNDLAIEGNTMVNYCRDGSKTLTLNGDINEVGTYITTTNAVNSGLVDVMCEGNTLVNLSNTNRYTINKATSDTNLVITSNTNYLKATTNGEIYNNNSWVYADFGKPKLSLLKPNTKYTVIGDVIKGIGTMAICDGSTVNALAPFSPVKNNRVLLTTNNLTSEINGQILYGWIKNNEEDKPIDIEVKNLMILEGDWTNKEVPSEFFEGMKSVGQDDENEHNIEIKAQNKNLLTSDKFEVWGNEINIEYSGDAEKYVECSKTPIEVKPNTTYTFSTLMKATSNLGSAEIYLYEYKKGETKLFKATPRRVSTNDILEFTRVSYTFTTSIGTDRILLRFDNNGSLDGNVATLTCKEYCLSLGNNTTYVNPMFNKKGISLNEPLRSLPNGVKDRIVKMNNKWYIERNCAEVVLNGSESWSLNTSTPNQINTKAFYCNILGISTPQGLMPNIITDKFMVRDANYFNNNDIIQCSSGNSTMYSIMIRHNSTSVENFKQWLQTNNVTVVYKLNTPIYEELTVEPTLTTYADCTHISTNSVIPCDMKVKNSGYSTIIKPSTLYTIALDTNKSGEVKVNLGGAEKTTTNNIVTITTPSTLVDDSLRISGKGLTSKNVRLLEGDKTNYIPPYFEGLKSSFEEKQGDNHIVEVVSENGDKSNKIQFSTLAPLRSVGDVSDKLVFKDNKWMIERNCGEVVLDGSTQATINSRDNFTKTIGFYIAMDEALKQTTKVLSNKFNFKLLDVSNDVYEFTRVITPNGVPSLYFKIFKIKLPTHDVNGFKKWLSNNPTTVVYELAEPYYEEIGEYRNLDSYDEGTTIYANSFIAPKSLSFSLASHMSNIVKDVQDDVSDLKTWRSEVFDSITHKKTFDSDFTTIEDTKEGVIDEFKLEGKTLVNYISNFNNWSNMGSTTVSDDGSSITINATAWNKGRQISKTLPSGYYIFSINNPNNATIVIQNKNNAKTLFYGNNADINFEFSLSEASDIWITCKNTSESGTYIVSNPILTVSKEFNTYFEGLKSVGQDVDEIEVESVKGDGNLVEYIELNGVIIANGKDYTDNKYVRTNYITVEPNQTYYIKPPTNVLYKGCAVYFYDSNKSYLGYKSGLTSEFTTVTNTKFIRIDMKKADDTGNTQEDINNCDFVVSKCRVSEYIPHQSDKKRLLFYNEETQTWEKPILREWDSIEKHLDGKYYYHQRSAEVVLNGSENWNNYDSLGACTPYLVEVPKINFNHAPISDKFVGSIFDGRDGEKICVGGSPHIIIQKDNSTLSSQDVQGFKQWLQANNVTAVYQLAEEKVYECTNIELNSYNGETNVIVDSGAISPITMVSLTSNLPQVAENLKNRVRQLEAELYNYKVNQNLRQLRTSYRSDYANFGVATLNNYSIEPTSIAITPYGYDLFEIFKEVIAQGKDKYDRIELEEYIDFYLMTFVFDFDMVFELFDLLDANEDIIEDEPVEEEPPTEEEEDVVEDTPTILPNLPEDEVTPIPLI